MLTLIYECTNPYSPNTNKDGKTLIGTCGGLTLEWTRSVIGLRAHPEALNGNSTLPDITQAQTAQRKWIEANETAAMGSSEVRLRRSDDHSSLRDVLERVDKAGEGRVHALWIASPDNRGHLVGLVKSGQNFYYFEPNAGMYKSPSKHEIRKQLEANLMSYVGRPNMAGFSFRLMSFSRSLTQAEAFAPQLDVPVDLPLITPAAQARPLPPEQSTSTWAPQSSSGPTGVQVPPQVMNYPPQPQHPQAAYYQPNPYMGGQQHHSLQPNAQYGQSVWPIMHAVNSQPLPPQGTYYQPNPNIGGQPQQWLQPNAQHGQGVWANMSVVNNQPQQHQNMNIAQSHRPPVNATGQNANRVSGGQAPQQGLSPPGSDDGSRGRKPFGCC